MGGGGKGTKMNFVLAYFLYAFSISLIFSLISVFFSWAFKKDLNFSSNTVKRIFLSQFFVFFILYLVVFVNIIRSSK